MAWGSIIGAGISAAASYLGSKKQQSTTDDVNQQQIDWQREAMQNRHQWEVEDLRKAGLNPILSANAGASTGGAGFHPQVPDYMQSYSAMAQNAISALKSIADIENVEANTKVADATVDRINQETENLGITGQQLGMNLKRDQENQISYEVGSRSGLPAQILQGIQSTWNRLGKWYNDISSTARSYRRSLGK